MRAPASTRRSTGGRSRDHRAVRQCPPQRQPLTTNAKSPVAHDTETEALVAHSGRLFAATDQWEYPGPSAFGQVLVKKSKTSPWTVFEQTQSLRVQALDSFPIPSDQGLGTGAFPPRHPGDRRRAVEDPVVARRRQVLLAREFLRSPGGRRHPRLRRARVGRGLGRLRRGPPDRGPPGNLVAGSPHLGVQSQTRAHRGPARVAGCGDPEGHGLRRLRRSPVHHHQHDALSAQRRRPAVRRPSLGPGVSSATGRAAQQRAPGHHLPHP